MNAIRHIFLQTAKLRNINDEKASNQGEIGTLAAIEPEKIRNVIKT